MTTQRIDIQLTRTIDESYPLIIGRNLTDSLKDVLAEPRYAKRKVAVITDSTVADLVARAVAEDLGERAQLFVFPAGEKSKVRATKERLEDAMLDAGFNRDSVIVAIGGGVVSDLAGFVAATFTRGIPYITWTTTLVGAADAAIGGKTAVDTHHATNLIGAFHQPGAVLIDVERWLTLDDSQIRDGMGETVKHACLADAHYFDVLENAFVERKMGLHEFVADEELSHYIAERNARIKQDFVQSDVHEGNRRMGLNLGHTIGRALEAAMGFTMTHGECVAVGLLLQAKLGLHFGYVSEGDVARMERLLKAIGLPTEIPENVTVDAIMDAMEHDKKALGGKTRFVFQHGIGALEVFEGGAYAREIDADIIREFLEAQR